MSCGIGYRHGSDPTLYGLAAVALIQPLAWELPYAMGVALKEQKQRKKRSAKVMTSVKNLIKAKVFKHNTPEMEH